MWNGRAMDSGRRLCHGTCSFSPLCSMPTKMVVLFKHSFGCIWKCLHGIFARENGIVNHCLPQSSKSLKAVNLLLQWQHWPSRPPSNPYPPYGLQMCRSDHLHLLPTKCSCYYNCLWKGGAVIQEDSKESMFSLVKHGLKGDMLIANTIFRERCSGTFNLKDNLVMGINWSWINMG